MLKVLSAPTIIHVLDENPACYKKNLSSEKKVAPWLPDSLVLLTQELICVVNGFVFGIYGVVEIRSPIKETDT